MLKAYLKRKVKPPVADDDDEDSRPADVTGLEDLLTSAVFERLAYLDPADVWQLLRETSRHLTGSPLQETAPDGSPSWAFWPRFAPGTLGKNARLVEPDVVVTWGSVVLIIEAKHRGTQFGSQWIEEICAVQGEHPNQQVFFIAAGGLDPRDAAGIVAGAQATLGAQTPPIFALSWGDLATAAAQRSRTRGGGTAVCYSDIAAVLHAWGYRPTTNFSTMPSVIAGLGISANPADIPRLGAT